MADWEFPGSDPIEIFISLPSGSIAVSGEPTDVTTVTLLPSGAGRGAQDASSDLRVEFRAGERETAGRLEIVAPKHLSLRRGSGVDVTVRAPAGSGCSVTTASSDVSCLGELRSLDARTASGDVTAVAVTGPVRVRTASGDVWLEQTGGEASLNTASGGIRLGRAGGDVTAKTASGDLSIASAEASVIARTASGRVRIDRIAAGEADVTSVSGDVTVGVAAGTGVYLDLCAVTGRISSQLDEAQEDGTGALTVKCRTVSGDVSIVRALRAPAR